MHDDARALAAYGRWANAQTLASLRAMESAPPPARAVAVMAHIVGAERQWLARMAGEPSPLAIWPDLDLTGCARELTALAAPWDELLLADPLDLGRVVRYTNSQGTAFATSVADILTHVSHHSAYHRGQIATMIRQAGGTPASTDYIVYVRTVRPAT